MKEELTEKMHSEFEIDSESEKRNIAFMIIGFMEALGETVEESIEGYEITKEELLIYKKEYDLLLAK
jgi:hypothetical protein